jgi:uncharacterized RDD family membrane protein YckC
MADEQTTPQQESKPKGDGKADLGKRFVAGLIDAVIAIVVGFIPIIGGIISAAYWLLRDGMDFEFMKRRSLGKKVMKLRPVTLDGSPVDIAVSIKRNWMFAFGGIVQLLMFIPVVGWALIPVVGVIALILVIIEIILVLTDPEGRRMGDKIANTKVIEVAE